MMRRLLGAAAIVALLPASIAAGAQGGPSRGVRPSSAGTSPPPAAPARRTPAPSGASFDLGVWHVMTDAVDLDWHSGDFTAPGKVTLQRDGGDAVADRASGNWKRKIATLYGHVVVHDAGGGFASLASAKNAPHEPSTLTADQLSIDGAAKIYTAIGHVHYVQGQTVADADRARLDDATHELTLEGHVVITQGDRSLRADRVVYDTVTGKGHAQGDVVLAFPSAVTPHIATPKPIVVKEPKIGGKPPR
jgi:lipopolysaccharide assembly outer membrane protein LptD (OstA)